MKTEELIAIVTPLLETKGLFLVDLTLSKDNVIGLFIDSMQGVNIQTCIEISRKIENSLNRETEDFELTVSSAGIGYPFKVEQQYQKNLNKTVEVKLHDNTRLTGILKSFDPETVCLTYEEKQTVPGSKKKKRCTVEKNISRADIREIRDVISFK